MHTSASIEPESRTRVLLIGPAELRDELARVAAPGEIVSAERAIDGLWAAGTEPFDAALLSTSLGAALPRAVESLRKINARLRLIIVAPLVEEPTARRALERGAHEYVLRPLRRDEVIRALGVAPPSVPEAAPIGAEPSTQEIQRLGEVLRELGDGPHAALDSMCRLVQDAFCASGALLQLDDLVASHGDVREFVVQQSIRRGDAVVGQIALARSMHGAYPGLVAARLVEYATLIEAAVSQAAQRERLEALAGADDVTGLPNRRRLRQELDAALVSASAHRRAFTLALIRIEGDDAIRSGVGRAGSEAAVRELADRLIRRTRRGDVVARVGEREFVVLLVDRELPRSPGSSHPRDARQWISRFAVAPEDGVAAPALLCGLAGYPWDGHTSDELLAFAENAVQQFSAMPDADEPKPQE